MTVRIENGRSDSDARGLWRLGALTLGMGLGYALLFCYAVHPILPFNPIKLPAESTMRTNLFIPEGWRFFTRNPQEEQPLAFSRQNGSWRSVMRGPNASAANLFGLDRAGRAQGLEMGLLMAEVHKRSFIECNEEPILCLEQAPSALSVRDASPDPTLCGTTGIVLRGPVPWAWARGTQSIFMPSRVARLEVRCSSE